MGRRFPFFVERHRISMAQRGQSIYPIQTLRDNIISLEAAILVCIAKPRKDAVHRLRTTTRRIDAQLELLAMLPHLPEHQKEARKAARLLRKLRHAAGEVRDLDVQRDLIRDEAAKKSRGKPSVRREARSLRRELKLQREQQSEELLDLLQKQHAKLTNVFERLLEKLTPAESTVLTEAQLTSLVHDWYAARCGNQLLPDAMQDPGRLHDIRKQAKLARYLAESAPESASRARRLAARFEDLQQAGGDWHDWLLLAEIAHQELGKSATLAERFTTHADRSLSL
jgi:CHAD domain-containing protein